MWNDEERKERSTLFTFWEETYKSKLLQIKNKTKYFWNFCKCILNSKTSK